MKFKVESSTKKAALVAARQLKQDDVIQALLDSDANGIEQFVTDSSMTDREIIAKLAKAVLWLYRNRQVDQ